MQVHEKHAAIETLWRVLVTLEKHQPGLNQQIGDQLVAFESRHEDTALAMFESLGNKRPGWRTDQLCDCLNTALDYLSKAGLGESPDPGAMFALLTKSNRVL